MEGTGCASDLGSGVRQGILIGAAILALVLPPARAGRSMGVPLREPTRAAEAVRPATLAPPPRVADFHGRPASAEARRVADWVARTGDNRARPYVILDKRAAIVYVLDPAGRLVDESPVLLGFAPGDDAVDGIGRRALDQVRAHEKTKPAGRFEAERGHDTTGEDVVWVDYDTSVAMHRVRVVDPSERRLERLASSDPAERRISFGCINVPVAFFEHVVAPVFAKAHAMVYVLPETKSLVAVFGPGVEARATPG